MACSAWYCRRCCSLAGGGSAEPNMAVSALESASALMPSATTAGLSLRGPSSIGMVPQNIVSVTMASASEAAVQYAPQAFMLQRDGVGEEVLEAVGEPGRAGRQPLQLRVLLAEFAKVLADAGQQRDEAGAGTFGLGAEDAAGVDPHFVAELDEVPCHCQDRHDVSGQGGGCEQIACHGFSFSCDGQPRATAGCAPAASAASPIPRCSK